MNIPEMKKIRHVNKISLQVTLALVFIVGLTEETHAQNYISVANGNWTSPIWIPAGFPTYSPPPGFPTSADIQTNVTVTSAVGANFVNVNPGGTLTITGTGSIAQSDEIQNHNTLTIDSGGTINANTSYLAYDGSVTSLGNGVNLSPNSYYILGNGNVEVDAGTATIGSVIQDFGGGFVGSQTKTGAGNLVLTNANTYSAGTTISNGALIVGNTQALGTGAVINNSVLTTNSAGAGLVIDVGGNYTQGGGGTLALNVYGQGNFDSVHLTNTGSSATVNGTLNITLAGNFAPGSGEVFHVVTTSNPIIGEFSNVVTNEPNLGARVYYTNDVILQLPFAIAGLTPNQYAVASYLDAHDVTIPNAAFGNLVTALSNVSGGAGGLGGYLDQLMPVNFAQFTSSVAFNNASFLTQQFDNYLASHRGPNGVFITSAGGIDYSALTVNDPDYLPGLQQVHSRLLAWNPAPNTGLLDDTTSSELGGTDMKEMKPAATEPPEENRWNAFVSGNAILAQDFSDATAGNTHQDLTTAAMQIGVDYQLTPNFLVGAMFGYGHTEADLDNIGSQATEDTYSPALYASFAKEGWYANALGSYGFSDYTQDRSVDIGAFDGSAHSSPYGDQIVGNVDGGYDFHRGGWTFGPTLGVQYVHLDVNDYTETGLPGADLTVNDDQSDSLRSRLGGRVSYVMRCSGLTFIPHLSASWQHEFLDQSRGITSQFDDGGAGSFLVKTERPSRDSALVDVGVDAEINQTVTVFVDYAAQAGQQNYFGQSVQAGVKVGF